MSHIVIFIGIPANKINSDYSAQHIDQLVENILEPYVEETTEEGKMKIDWYQIGGRWEGAVAAVKGTQDVYPARQFAYQMDEYIAVCCKGMAGPYIAGNTEYIPVTGARSKDIAWDALNRLELEKNYTLWKMLLNRDPLFGGKIPDGLEIRDGDLYLKDGNFLVLKQGETQEELIKRMNYSFNTAIMPPDAYVDLEGNWHDDNEIWDEWASDFNAMSKMMSSDQNPHEKAQEEFCERAMAFSKNLADDDYFIVIDGHRFL